MKSTFDFIPKHSFIYEYMQFCNNIETAENFDFWGAVWVLSLLINRKLIIKRPQAPLFPNFYITLVAESGIARKSSAINIAKDMLDDIIDKDSDINLLNSSTSAAKFNYVLTKSSIEHDNCIIGINCPEFITFYKNKSIIECFTDLYDCPNERIGYGTFTNGEINIRNVFVSSFAGSTPNYYFKAVSKDEVEGGYTSRSIIITAEQGKRKIPWGKRSTSEKVIETGRRIYEKIIQSKRNEFGITDSAIRCYSNWYIRRRKSTDEYTRTFESREQDHVLKLAAILCINRKSFVIDEEDIKNAIKVITKVKKSSQKFINSELFVEEKDDYVKTIEKIRDIIHSYGSNGIKHRDLYLRIHNSCTNEEFIYIINMMHELNMIEKLQLYNSKAIIYRETKNLYNVNLKQFTF